tara:strand:- start:100 stop:360 length:261 start_codon:yes stop_codon:yes gene_type:complete
MEEKKIPSSFFTPKQKKVWDFIKDYFEDMEYPPTYAEIQEFMKFKSVSQVHHIVNQLKIKGYVTNLPGIARSIYAKDPNSNIVRSK